MFDIVKDNITQISETLSPISLEVYLRALKQDLTNGTSRSIGELHTDDLRKLGKQILSNFDPSEEPVSSLIAFAKGVGVALERERRRVRAEFVWTGPRTSVVQPRRTEQVLVDLIDSSKHELLLVSFVAFKAGNIYERLNAAVGRSVTVRVILESSKSEGGSLNTDPVSEMRNSTPGCQFYRWVDRGSDFSDGRVHAKVFISDRERALLTSANLTNNALERNMEAGILSAGGRLPRLIVEHFDELINGGVLAKS